MSKVRFPLITTATAIFVSAGLIAAVAQMPAGVPAPGPDPQFVQNALAILQQQRNGALDQVAQAQAQLALTQSKLDAAQKEIAALKAAAAPKKEPAK